MLPHVSTEHSNVPPILPFVILSFSLSHNRNRFPLFLLRLRIIPQNAPFLSPVSHSSNLPPEVEYIYPPFSGPHNLVPFFFFSSPVCFLCCSMHWTLMPPKGFFFTRLSRTPRKTSFSMILWSFPFFPFFYGVSEEVIGGFLPSILITQSNVKVVENKFHCWCFLLSLLLCVSFRARSMPSLCPLLRRQVAAEVGLRLLWGPGTSAPYFDRSRFFSVCIASSNEHTCWLSFPWSPLPPTPSLNRSFFSFL